MYVKQLQQNSNNTNKNYEHKYIYIYWISVLSIINFVLQNQSID